MRLNKNIRREKAKRLTNREDVSFPAYHLIRLSRNEKILPDICRAACINPKESADVEPVAL
jgi:hypothetical protein